MPAPQRVSVDAILDAGRQVLEAGGIDAFTMQAVATRLGVRPPSLHGRVGDRQALLAAVLRATLVDLGDVLERADAAGGREPERRIAAMATAARAFAARNPNAWAAIFAPGAQQGADPAELAAASAPLVTAAAELARPDALEAARTLTAWLHGFVTMEHAGAFRLGGDVDAAFAYGLDRLLAALR